MGLEFDLDWVDDDVVPERIYPDTAFIFARMAGATMEMVAPGPGETILDLGCGRAVDALEMARLGSRAIGLDPSGTMLHEARDYVGDGNVSLVRGIGESLPFRQHSLDKVVCKGALDHFPDPERTMGDIALTLKPGGAVIIAIANFESLSCRLGKAWHPIISRLTRRSDERPPWEIPPDHTVKFDYPTLVALMERHFHIERTVGVSLLWTAPYWGRILELMPRRVQRRVLSLLDGIGRRRPSMSDVIIVRCTPKT